MNAQRLGFVVVVGLMGAFVVFVALMAVFNAGRRSAGPPSAPVAVQPEPAPVLPPPPPMRTELDRIRDEAVALGALYGDAQAAALEDWNTHTSAITYPMLERNAANFEGDTAMFAGTIVEIHDYDGGTMLRLATGRYDSDVMWIESAPGCTVSPNLVADDRVRVYGYLAGSHTYETQAGWSMTIPAMLAVAVVPNSLPTHISAATRAREGIGLAP